MIKRQGKTTQKIDKNIKERIPTSSLSTDERLKVIANLIIDKLILINQNKLKNLES